MSPAKARPREHTLYFTLHTSYFIFYTLYFAGTATGAHLREWCVSQGWLLVWSLGLNTQVAATVWRRHDSQLTPLRWRAVVNEAMGLLHAGVTKFLHHWIRAHAVSEQPQVWGRVRVGFRVRVRVMVRFRVRVSPPCYRATAGVQAGRWAFGSVVCV